jgi:hypothetical protein
VVTFALHQRDAPSARMHPPSAQSTSDRRELA